MIHLSISSTSPAFQGHREYDITYAQNPESATQALTYWTSTDNIDPIEEQGTDVCVGLNFDASINDLETAIAAQLTSGNFPEWAHATATITEAE